MMFLMRDKWGVPQGFCAGFIGAALVTFLHVRLFRRVLLRAFWDLSRSVEFLLVFLALVCTTLLVSYLISTSSWWRWFAFICGFLSFLALRFVLLEPPIYDLGKDLFLQSMQFSFITIAIASVVSIPILGKWLLHGEAPVLSLAIKHVVLGGFGIQALTVVVTRLIKWSSDWAFEYTFTYRLACLVGFFVLPVLIYAYAILLFLWKWRGARLRPAGEQETAIWSVVAAVLVYFAMITLFAAN